MLPDLATRAFLGPTLAVVPIVILVVLVLRSRLSTAANALVAAGSAAVLAVVVFGAGPATLAVAGGKGLWSGLWILYVIWPALLLYHVASAAGLDRTGPAFATILPRPVENVLIVAWIFPSFIQGIAGFGTPIAVAAPLLLAMGYGPVRAVAMPLVGYHWSVTFGSMGSSFYMASLTAGLSRQEQAAFAIDAAVILAVNMAVAGVLVCLMHGGWRSVRDGARLLLVAVPAMALALLVAARIEPSIGSLAAGTAGLGVVAARRLAASRSRPTAPATPPTHRRRVPAPVAVPVGPGERPPETGHEVAGAPPARSASSTDAAPDRPALTLLPYGYLLVLVLAVFLPPASRAFVKDHAQLGPAFPETVTATGVVNPAVELYTPIGLLSHPGSYVLLAALLGYLTFRVLGHWPDRPLRTVLGPWVRQASHSSLSVLALTTLATVMVDAGMVRAVATGAAELAGSFFPAIAPTIGALGSFTTGSTTTSNALFSALQRDVAVLIGVGPSELLAAQTAGGNVGNALAPVVILIGASAVQARERVGEILRAVLWPCAVLLLTVVAATLVAIVVRS